MQIKIIKADKTCVDGVSLVTLNKPYTIHHDKSIGDFIIGDKGKSGLITLSDIDFYKSYYGWVTIIIYE